MNQRVMFIVFFGASLLISSGQASANFSGKKNSYAMAYPVLKEKCAACHSSESKLPLIAHIPGIKQIYKHERAEALAGLNIDTEIHAENKAPLPTALDSIEHMLRKGKMPPLTYRMTHWGKGLSAIEKQAILDWIRDERAGP